MGKHQTYYDIRIEASNQVWNAMIEAKNNNIPYSYWSVYGCNMPAPAN